MASTYSSLLRFELIGSGEQAGLWGNSTNNNIGSLIEQAIAGVTFVSLTGVSSPYSLSLTNGTPDEARSAVLVLIGVPSGLIQIVVPGLQKSYIVKNASTQTITLKTAAQVGGIDIVSGGTLTVFCDGASVYSSLEKLSIGQGGTAASDAAGARANLAVPSLTGTGASGTWGINISGLAALATFANTATFATSAGAASTATNATNVTTSIAGTGIANFSQLTLVQEHTAARYFTGGLVSGANTSPSPNWNTYTQGKTSHPSVVTYGTGPGGTGWYGIVNATNVNMAVFAFGAPNAAVDVGTITTNGTSIFYNTVSDYRLKEKFGKIVNAAVKVMLLNPCTFTWKRFPDGKPDMGFIAHEVQAIVPQAITGEKDAEKMQVMDMTHLVPLLTAALQEALLRIDALEHRFNRHYG